MTVRTVAQVSLRELARRRVALIFVFVLPLVFYLSRIDVSWQAIRFLSIGVGWAIATLSLFSHVASRDLDRRLTVLGASPSALFWGRQLALVGVGVVVAGAYFAVVVLSQDDLARLHGVGLLLLTTVAIGVPLGTLVGLVVGRELEGALALLAVMAVQLLVDPADAPTKAMPLWSTRELSSYAIEAGGGDALVTGMLHFFVTAAACFTVAWAASLLRVRPIDLPAPRQDAA